MSRNASTPLGIALSLAHCVACGASATTERIFDGRTAQGPYIEPGAYAAYAEGAYLEAQGEWRAAEDAYRRALRHAPDSPGIWTRIGVIQCRTDLARALEAFRTATEHFSHGPAWAARARCLHGHGQTAEALEAARVAIGFDPANADANLLIADIHREGTQLAASKAWLFAWLLFDPAAVSHWKALDERARALQDPALTSLLRSALERGAEQGSELSAAARSALGSARREPELHPHLGAAVARGDLEAALSEAQAAGLSPLELAVHALRLGKPELAASQAKLVLDADPKNADAWIVALCAAAGAPDEAAFERLLAQASSAELPSPEFARRVAELIAWWVGDDAASEWIEAYRVQTRAGP